SRSLCCARTVPQQWRDAGLRLRPRVGCRQRRPFRYYLFGPDQPPCRRDDCLMTAPRILVVDDEADLRELLEITFIKMGLDVDSVETLGAARATLAEREYAMVLTDMRLPDGQGIELVREVASGARNTPIAVITAYGSADNAV